MAFLVMFHKPSMMSLYVDLRGMIQGVQLMIQAMRYDCPYSSKTEWNCLGVARAPLMSKREEIDYEKQCKV